MTSFKIITGINWVLISIYGAFALWALLQKANSYNDAGGGDMEVAIKGVGVLLLLILIGLNLTPYSWTKITALILAGSLLLLIRYIATH